MSFSPTTGYAKAKVMPSKICGSDFLEEKGRERETFLQQKSAAGNSCKRSLTSAHFGAVFSAPQNYNTSQKTTNISVTSRTNISLSPICSNTSLQCKCNCKRTCNSILGLEQLQHGPLTQRTSLTSWQHYCLQPLSSLMEYVIAVWKYGY